MGLNLENNMPKVSTREFKTKEKAESAMKSLVKKGYRMAHITRQIRWVLTYHK